MKKTIFVGLLSLMCSLISMAQSEEDDRKKFLEALDRTNSLSAHFKIPDNEKVYFHFKKILKGDRRQFLIALKRMKIHEKNIEQAFSELDLPIELKAIPIVESKYQNVTSKTGAGIWMFIKPTARRFGLNVSKGKDERLNPAKQTRAAAKLLNYHYSKFKSWELSLLAYNAGEGTVEKGIKKTGSRDVWTLMEAGFQNDKDYVAKVLAAILLMNHPESFEKT